MVPPLFYLFRSLFVLIKMNRPLLELLALPLPQLKRAISQFIAYQRSYFSAISGPIWLILGWLIRESHSYLSTRRCPNQLTGGVTTIQNFKTPNFQFLWISVGQDSVTHIKHYFYTVCRHQFHTVRPNILRPVAIIYTISRSCVERLQISKAFLHMHMKWSLWSQQPCKERSQKFRYLRNAKCLKLFLNLRWHIW